MKTKAKWVWAVNGTSEKPYFILREDRSEYYPSVAKLRRFGTQRGVMRRVDLLNKQELAGA
jgi:hypothetical protein